MTRSAPPSPTIAVTVPLPPSTNALWSTAPGKKRVRSPAYSVWLREAGWLVRMQLVGVPPITGTFAAQVTVPASCRRDRDNHTKPLFDLLQHVGAIRNDSGLRDYTVTAGERTDVLVALWDLGGPEQRQPKVLRASRPRQARATPAQVARYRNAGVLV